MECSDDGGGDAFWLRDDVLTKIGDVMDTIELQSSFAARCEPTYPAWPPRIDRKHRAALLDRGFDKFERFYGCRVLCDVAKLWIDPFAHRRVSQKGQLWHELRAKMMTGSRVANACGINTYPNSTRRKVFQEYCGLDDDPFQSNAATEHGVYYEDCCVLEMEKVLQIEGGTRCVTLPFDFMVSKRVEHFAYSPDGITSDGDLVEVKCPHTRRIIPGYIPFHYDQGQIQYGLYALAGPALSGRCQYAEYRPPILESMPETCIVSVTTVGTDRNWEKTYRWILDEFWDEVLEFRKTGAVPDHYASPARFDVWWETRRAESLRDSYGGGASGSSRLWPPTKREIAARKRRALEQWELLDTSDAGPVVDRSGSATPRVREFNMDAICGDVSW